jgi:hypothetical protein
MQQYLSSEVLFFFFLPIVLWNFSFLLIFLLTFLEVCLCLFLRPCVQGHTVPCSDVFVCLAAPGVSAGKGEDRWSVPDEVTHCALAVTDDVF